MRDQYLQPPAETTRRAFLAAAAAVVVVWETDRLFPFFGGSAAPEVVADSVHQFDLSRLIVDDLLNDHEARSIAQGMQRRLQYTAETIAGRIYRAQADTVMPGFEEGANDYIDGLTYIEATDRQEIAVEFGVKQNGIDTGYIRQVHIQRGDREAMIVCNRYTVMDNSRPILVEFWTYQGNLAGGSVLVGYPMGIESLRVHRDLLTHELALV